MYTYIMERTQIYLTTEQAEVLDRLAAARGTTRSHLIREAIDTQYVADRQSQRDRLLASLEAARDAARANIRDGDETAASTETLHGGGRWRDLYGDEWSKG
jgi:predicted DNA-binding protein